jgi:cytoplasmic iron level regulating protein YaaA (DUF328/UPF0246 family)
MNKTEMFVLIPPSEGKQPGGDRPPLTDIAAPARSMIERLQSYGGDLERLYGVKGPALIKAVRINQGILKSPTCPAIERYTGVVYKAIDYPSLDAKAKQFFNSHARIVSAVFGLLAPLDLIADYKLKIDKLEAQVFWNNILTPRVRGIFCVNLLPQAHRRAVSPDKNLSIDFTFKKGNKSLAAGHHGKHIKGRFVRWLCEYQVTGPDRFEEFQEDGFRWTGAGFIKDL